MIFLGMIWESFDHHLYEHLYEHLFEHACEHFVRSWRHNWRSNRHSLPWAAATQGIVTQYVERVREGARKPG